MFNQDPISCHRFPLRVLAFYLALLLLLRINSPAGAQEPQIVGHLLLELYHFGAVANDGTDLLDTTDNGCWSYYAQNFGQQGGPIYDDGTMRGGCHIEEYARIWSGELTGKYDSSSAQVTFHAETFEIIWNPSGWARSVLILDGSGGQLPDSNSLGGNARFKYTSSGNDGYLQTYEGTMPWSMVITFSEPTEAPAAIVKSFSADDPTFLDVKILRKGMEIIPAAGMKLYDQDQIRTGYKTEMALIFPRAGDVTVVVEELTEFQIGLFRLGEINKMELWLKVGGVQAEVLKREVDRTQFSVKTPTVTASSRGTQFRVHYDEGTQTTTVSVAEGEVNIVPVNEAFGLLTLSAGQQMEITPDAVGAVTAYIPPPSEGEELAGAEPVQPPTGLYSPLPMLAIGVACCGILGLLTLSMVGLVFWWRTKRKRG